MIAFNMAIGAFDRWKVMEMKLTNLNRAEAIHKMSETEYDVVVIGGGITGAGIALDSATRGMKVALLEMQDFAAGTSSRSTKLIHGGLRYLKQLEVKMVADVGKERAIVFNNGPHVTTPEWMLLPFYEEGSFGPRSTSIGLKVYDVLAGVQKDERRQMLSADEVLEKEPLLKSGGLKGGGLYVEYRTDDARLTIEVIKKAVEFGAEVINYVKVTQFLYEHGKIMGIATLDQLTGQTAIVRGKKIINATGPWVDELREMDHSKTKKSMQLTKGVHIVIDQSRFPLQQAVYFDTEDGRMVFAIPREGKSYVGTTDTIYEDEPTCPTTKAEDRAYLLKAIQFMFPQVEISEDDIESSWAGVRPLIREEGKDPSEISRKDEIWVSKSGLITIAGGKLTGYRKMAEEVVDLLASQFKEEKYKLFDECCTRNLPISGGDVGGPDYFPDFLKEAIRRGMEVGLTEEEAAVMSKLYGSNIAKVFAFIEENEAEIKKYNLSKDVYGKLKYAIEAEMIATPVDFFYRRIGALLFNIDWVYEWKEKVVKYMSAVFGWNEEEEKERRDELQKAIVIATNAP